MAGLSDKEREDLVAYLDGELDASSSCALETRLTLDPQAREEAIALKKTWELLDYLPRPEPSPQFTSKTLDRVAVPTRLGKQDLRLRRWPPWVRGLGWAAAILLAAGVGFGGIYFWTGPGSSGTRKTEATRPNPLAGMCPPEIDRQLVHNLRLIENKRLYENIDDIEFLQELANPELFGEEK